MRPEGCPQPSSAASSTRPELTGIALTLEASPVGEDLAILTDSLVAMTTLFSLRRADFPLSLHRNSCRLLITHVVKLLNERQAAGVVTRFIKVKSHQGEPLNEAADALASAAAEVDDSPSMPQQLEPETVHFYVKGVPVVWCAVIRDHTLAGMIFEAVRDAGAGWIVHRGRFARNTSTRGGDTRLG